MNKKFEKKISMMEMLRYYKKKLKVVLVASILACIGIVAIDALTVEQYTADVVDGNYVCTTLVSIIPEKTQEGKVPDETTFMAVMISDSAIQAAIDDLKLTENYIDIFNKMSWEAQGDTVKLSIESPLKEVDGYDWKEVMSTIVSEGEKVVRSHYAIASFEVIDEAYYESESHQTGDIALSTRFQVKRDILLTIIVAILISIIVMLKYLLNTKITSPEDVEENLALPVLTQTKDMGRIANIILNSRGKMKSICVLGFQQTSLTDVITEQIGEELRKRKVNVGILSLNKEQESYLEQFEQLQKENEIVIVNGGNTAQNVQTPYIAGKCDTTLVVIENNKVDGNKAIGLQRELELNGASTLGAVYIC